MSISLAAPSSTLTLANLKADVSDWLHRSDLTSRIPSFVRLAESDIRNDVRVQAMEAEASGTVTALAIAFPTRFLAARRLLVDGRTFRYLMPERFAAFEPGVADVYTVIGSEFRVNRGSTYALTFWRAFPDLVADTDTNWLLQNAYDVYLHATLKHAAVWAEDEAAMTKHGTLYQSGVQRVNGREAQARYSGQLTARAR